MCTVLRNTGVIREVVPTALTNTVRWRPEKIQRKESINPEPGPQTRAWPEKISLYIKLVLGLKGWEGFHS